VKVGKWPPRARKFLALLCMIKGVIYMAQIYQYVSLVIYKDRGVALTSTRGKGWWNDKGG